MCTYHKERGHYTTQCQPFKRYLEELAAAGHLNRWIDGRRSSLPPPPPIIGNLVSVIQGLVSEDRAAELRSEIDRAITSLPVCNVGISGKRQREDLSLDNPITFTSDDLKGVQLLHTDALVVTITIDRSTVQRVLIDQGSSADVMFYSTFQSLGSSPAQLRTASTPLVSFTRAPVWPLGLISLPVRAGSRVLEIEFVVVASPSPYNVILGRTWLHEMKAVASTFHQVVKFVGWNGRQESLRGDQIQSKEVLHQHCNKQKELYGSTRSICLDSARNAGCGSHIRRDALNVDPSKRPVVQKVRRSSAAHVEAVMTKVDQLLKAGAIREVLYPTWHANPVIVPKKNGKLRVCVDYTNLNDACSMDRFSLPRIEQMVDATAGCERLSFMDAYRGYHQIALAPEDQEKTAFIFSSGNLLLQGRAVRPEECWCNLPMLHHKDVSCTFARDHLRDLGEVFDVLNRRKLRLNAEKCAFGVSSGKFLSYIVSRRRIEANPTQILAVQNL
ncbi:uncharacterized protein LOC131330971 [Rhododendron vialii]|uniref:uncharacterized protein LOC131330971 n=1 Tax=Rhododendron vialii TaxID=182163 RepID=UPI00265F9FCF|nr:uncharacterized protein LOC131330971 [Rhododendron vialii]